MNCAHSSLSLHEFIEGISHNEINSYETQLESKDEKEKKKTAPTPPDLRIRVVHPITDDSVRDVLLLFGVEGGDRMKGSIALVVGDLFEYIWGGQGRVIIDPTKLTVV